jgi:eukaryotic-like serine/threonine-protein kinase
MLVRLRLSSALAGYTTGGMEEHESNSIAEALIRSVLLPPHERLDRRHGQIAEGGMASVELAWDRMLERRVALKLMHAEYQRNPLAVRSFIREAQVTGQLDHPNIVPVHELAVDPAGRLCFTMKLVEGRTLLELLDGLRAGHERIDAHGLKISTTLEHEDLLRMIDVMLRVFDAVAFAHSRGVAHCDLKPANVMVGDFGQVYVMDWGIAKLLPDRQLEQRRRVRDNLMQLAEETNLVMGTPAYMSPEQARGARNEIDHRADVFALGATLFEILTGHPPYQGQDAAEELELANACKAVLLPHLAITRELRRIVAVAMHPDPSSRYQSIEQFRVELQGFMRGGDNFPRRRFSKGDSLIREGEASDAAYILVSGRCEVFKQVKGRRESLHMLGPGDVFGETSILASTPRTASVVALTEVVAVIVTADVLEREIGAMKPWMGSFIRALALRFTDVENRSHGLTDPVQIANLALMTLKTWGVADAKRGPSMSAMRLCESVGKLARLSADEVLKILRQYAQFKIMLSQDVISLPDEPGLVAELRRFL